MKIKKIAAICNQEGEYRLYDHVDSQGTMTQWLGTQSAFYPLLGAPTLNTDSLCTMLDIPEQKREKLSIQCVEMPGIDVRDISEKDIRLNSAGIVITYHGVTLLPLMAGKETIFIQKKFLEPLDEKGMLGLYLRRTEGLTYIVAKLGLIVQGIILPHIELEIEDISNKMEAVAWGYREWLAKWRPKQRETQSDLLGDETGGGGEG